MMMKIGKYEIIDEIGKGAMGVVYKAHDPQIGRDVAIKMISESILDVPEIKARFYREARSVGKLSHENICVIHDVGEDNGRPYIVMEYLPGDDLRSIINRKTPLRLAQKIDYLKQICRGLQYAHTKNIIHRDIKPENIKIQDDGKVKIMDFGIAKPLSGDLSHTGTQIGTPWYMSPEQIRGTKLDQRADIFSFGVVFYELLTFRRPFDGEAATVMYKILQEPPNRLAFEENEAANELEAVVMKCLEKEVEKRHDDFAAILQILDQINRQVEHRESAQILAGEGRVLMERQLFKDAIAKFDGALRLNPNHTEAQALRERAVEQEKYFQTLKIMMGEMKGETISHYRISERIGAGGMGIVYKAEDSKLRRPVALKFLPPELTQDEAAKKRFVREAQAASALDHPNIYTIYEIDETAAGQLFICMAYYDGLTLKKTITDCELRLADCVNIASQIAQGLVVAHAHGIIHRDIKPANVIITKEGVTKIVDFGLAKLAGGTRITKTGVSMGTLAYMSPEQIKNTDIDHRTDIWALGVIVYEMLSGKLPFQCDYDLAQLYAIPHQPHIPIAQFNSEVSRELEAIIDKALQKQAADRYASMPEMLKELKQVHRQLGASASGMRFATKIERAKTSIARTVAEPGADADSEIVSLLMKGKLYLEQKKYPEALSRFRAALEVDPNAQQARELLVECERQQKAQEQMARLLTAAKNYFDKGDYKSAVQAYQEILTLNPELPEANEAIKKIEDSLEQTEKLEKLISDAEFYLKKEKFERAVEVFREALSLDPNNKPAIRGLQRAEKGLETRRRVTDRQKEPAPTPEKKPIAKNLWLGLAAVAVLGIAGTGGWYLWSRFNSDAQLKVTPGERADLSGPAHAAQNALSPLKTQAREAGVETWAAETYRHAVEIEQKADQQLAEGNYAAAQQTYKAAADSLTAAIAAARLGVAAEMTKGLNQLKARLASTKREMQKARQSAENVNAETLVAALFADAARRERDGVQNEALGSNESLLAAQQAYAEATNSYTKAKRQVDLMIQARVVAENAKSSMERTKSLLPESEEARKRVAPYVKAEEAARQGNRQFQAADYEAARNSFREANTLYLEADKEMSKNMRRSQAEAAKATMQEARNQVDPGSYNEAQYGEAEKFRQEAETAYNGNDFAGAAEKYKAAESLFVAVVREAGDQAARERERLSTAGQAARQVILRYGQMLEQRNYAGFKALFKNFSREDEKFWSAFFENTKNVKANLAIKNLALSANTATVEVGFDLSFYNVSRGLQENQTVGQSSWVLEQENGRWTIAQDWRQKK